MFFVLLAVRSGKELDRMATFRGHAFPFPSLLNRRNSHEDD